MASLFDFIITPSGFLVAYGAMTVWLGGWIAASVVYRKRRGKPIFPRPPNDAIFVERTASGASRKNLLTRIGGASNCLVVAVCPDRVVISTWFPFSLMFLPEIYDLEFDIPLQAIRQVRETRLMVLLRSFLLTFALPDGRERTIHLRLRNPDAFLAALSRNEAVRRLIVAA
ncbi:MAG: hypothetical protein JSR86_09865 [Proteobacteria bacterium]|nr:hypothetical protein [Pseudomonadota bacterium]